MEKKIDQEDGKCLSPHINFVKLHNQPNAFIPSFLSTSDIWQGLCYMLGIRFDKKDTRTTVRTQSNQIRKTIAEKYFNRVTG